MVCDSLHIICGNCGSLLTIGNENNEKVYCNNYCRKKDGE